MWPLNSYTQAFAAEIWYLRLKCKDYHGLIVTDLFSLTRIFPKGTDILLITLIYCFAVYSLLYPLKSRSGFHEVWSISFPKKKSGVLESSLYLYRSIFQISWTWSQSDLVIVMRVLPKISASFVAEQTKFQNGSKLDPGLTLKS